MLHKHRIKPGHEGGVYEDGNVVLLTPTQHAMWHFAEWQRKGKWEDRVAWRFLAGQATLDETKKEAIIEGARKGGQRSKQLRVGICDPNIGDLGRRKVHASGQPQQLGLAQGRLNAENGTLARARQRSTMNSKKFKCLITGKITTAGPLTVFQRARGIDTSLREQID